MWATGLCDVELATAAAAKLKALRGDGTRHRVVRHAEGGVRASAGGSAPPAEETKFSLLDEAERSWDVEKAAIHESVTPLNQSTDVLPCKHTNTIAGALAAHIDDLPDEQIEGLFAANRVILARIAPALATALDVPTLSCPNRGQHTEPSLRRSVRKHIEENVSKTGRMVTARACDAAKVRFASSGIRGNTVVPEHVLPGGRAGVLPCFDPSCYSPDGRRATFMLDELLPGGAFTALTLHELALIWGFSYDSLYKALIRRATTPLTPVGKRRDANGRVSATFCVGDALRHPTMAKRLAAAHR